jgi:aminopeptidase N
MDPNRRARPVGDPYLPGSGDDGYHVGHYDLAITYRPATNRLDGHATIRVISRRTVNELSFDLAGLTVAKVLVNGVRPKRFVQRGAKLIVTLSRPAVEDTELQVAITYSGHPKPVRGHWGEVGWEELREGALVAGQPNGAPSWFPCNDHPGNKATYRIEVTTDSPFTVVANGTPTSRTVRASRTTWAFEQREPMATYLATVQIGRYDVHELPSSSLPQFVFAPARLSKPIRSDFGRQDRMLRCFTDCFGPYPFPAYAVVVTDDPLEIPLEAQGMSIFGANHVEGLRLHERLVAHELAHQWFGNSLTPARWSDIWLNEGFACYAEWLWSEDSGGDAADVHARRQWQRLQTAAQDLVLADPGPDLMFDDRVYKRGALALHALRCSVGTAPFFELLRSWTSANKHGSVTTDAFLAHVAATAGEPARELLTPWLYERPLPPLPAAPGRRGR